MKKQTLDGNWNEIKGKIKQQWGKITDDDLERMEGNRDEIVGRIQQMYGAAQDEIEQQLDQLTSTPK